PSVVGQAAAMSAALRSAGLELTAVDAINAHGTGTLANDRTECAALRAVLGATAGRVAVGSTKGAHGHVIGATGAVELLACILALRDGIVPPTAGCTAPAADCGLDIVTGTARAAPIGAALSNSFAFGGLNAVLALRAA
ncbi:MAG: beta-ACP synthase, partial [Paracoccaceae bacterium]